MTSINHFSYYGDFRQAIGATSTQHLNGLVQPLPTSEFPKQSHGDKTRAPSQRVSIEAPKDTIELRQIRGLCALFFSHIHSAPFLFCRFYVSHGTAKCQNCSFKDKRKNSDEIMKKNLM